MTIKMRLLLGMRLVIFSPIWLPLIITCFILYLISWLGDRAFDGMRVLCGINPFLLWNITAEEKMFAEERRENKRLYKQQKKTLKESKNE